MVGGGASIEDIAGQLLLPRELGASVLSGAWFAVILGTLALALLSERRRLFDRIDTLPWAWRGAVFALLAFVVTVFAATDGHVAFLYFQF